MEIYCVKYKKNTKNIDSKILSTSNGKAWYYQNVQYAVVKNQDLLKIKKQKDY